MDQTRTVTEWAARRIEDGALVTTRRVGLYAPEAPMTEEGAARWVQHLGGYEVVQRTITTTTGDWRPTALAAPVPPAGDDERGPV